MERSELFDLMGELQLYGMKAAFDEIMATAIKRQHEPQRIIGDLLTAEINEKKARSIKYQLTMPSCHSPRTLTTSSSTVPRSTRPWYAISPAADSLPSSVMPVLVGGTGTGKTHLGHRHCQKLHQSGRSRPVLQCRRPRQSARDRGA